MARIYEALKKAEELRAAAQGPQLQASGSFADAMPNFRIAPFFYIDHGTVPGTADLAKHNRSGITQHRADN